MIKDTSWLFHLKEETEKPYFTTLLKEVEKEYAENTCYPAYENIFRAFDLCPFDKVKVIILGQDPYHGVGQADGLAFSVPKDITIPPSLKNIFKEMQLNFLSDTDFMPPSLNGDLEYLARQGVLLLNSTLTVRAGTPTSHQKLGWQNFTDAVVKILSMKRKELVFMLWGNYSKRKNKLIDPHKHLVLEASHPSPLSANKGGWFGCEHFSKANRYLENHKKDSIEWI